MFIAFNALDAFQISKGRRIRQDLFTGKTVPLKHTPCAALEAARTGKILLCAKAALEVSDWYVLGLTFTSDHISSAFVNNQLRRQNGRTEQEGKQAEKNEKKQEGLWY